MVLGDLEFYLINHKWFSIFFSYRQAKDQYLEVNFTCKVKINRLVTKGHGENYVKSFFLFYSKDGRIFKPYKLGSKKMVRELPWDDLLNNEILIIQFKNVCPAEVDWVVALTSYTHIATVRFHEWTRFI